MSILTDTFVWLLLRGLEPTGSYVRTCTFRESWLCVTSSYGDINNCDWSACCVGVWTTITCWHWLETLDRNWLHLFTGFPSEILDEVRYNSQFVICVRIVPMSSIHYYSSPISNMTDNHPSCHVTTCVALFKKLRSVPLHPQHRTVTAVTLTLPRWRAAVCQINSMCVWFSHAVSVFLSLVWRSGVFPSVRPKTWDKAKEGDGRHVH